MLGEILIGGMASLLICVFVGPRFIDYLRVREFGQHIREEGPAGHQGKAGTPTMGGLAVLLAVLVPFLILSDYRQASLTVLGTTVAMAALGFADDWNKLRKRRSLGVSGRTKLVIQALTAIALWLAVTEYVGLGDNLRLRFVDASIDLGVAYPILIFLVLAGATNGVNLTDGLDGLAAGCCAIVFLTFTAMTFITTGQQDLALLSACLVGACVGFLWFNSFPASVFMGDTGSLGLGGGIAALAVGTQTEGLLIVIGVRCVVKSPGVPGAAAVIAAARERGIPVLGELEIAWRLLPNRFVAVTGTNGKTTTTELLGAIWREAGLPVEVAGNVGTPLSSLVGEVDPDATIVCEVSSFQAEDSEGLAPDTALLLNITEDHLDRHGSFEAYRDAKLRLFANQTPEQVAVVPPGMEVPGAGRRVEFGPLPLPAEEIRLRGEHNLENARGAAAAAIASGVPAEAVAGALRSFARVPHP